MNPTQSGEHAEGIVMTRLMTMGLGVLIPLSTVRYDLAADVGGEILKVQVKKGQKRGTSISANTYSQERDGSISPYSSDEVDAFAVYFPETDTVYWVPFDDAPETLISLSLLDPDDVGPGQRHRMRFAEEYELESMLSEAWGATP